MIYGARFYTVVVAAFVFCPTAQLLAEDKEPLALIELGAATERSIQEGTYSAGPSVAVEFPVILRLRRASLRYTAQARPNGRPIFSSKSHSRSMSESSL